MGNEVVDKVEEEVLWGVDTKPERRPFARSVSSTRP